MNIYISDVVRSIDEDMIHALVNDGKQELSDERIRTLVFGAIEDEKAGNSARKISGKKILIIAIAASLAMGAIAGAGYLGRKFLSRNEEVNDENRKFIGEEVQGPAIAGTKEPSELGETPGEINKRHMELLKKETDIVTSYEEGLMIPESASEITVTSKNGTTFVYPEQILVNGAVSIMKLDNGGWKLKQGQLVSVEYEKYPSKVVENQHMKIGYICDGKMMEGEIVSDMHGEITFEIDKSGEYYFYFISYSSDYLSLKEKKILLYK